MLKRPHCHPGPPHPLPQGAVELVHAQTPQGDASSKHGLKCSMCKHAAHARGIPSRSLCARARTLHPHLSWQQACRWWAFALSCFLSCWSKHKTSTSPPGAQFSAQNTGQSLALWPPCPSAPHTCESCHPARKTREQHQGVREYTVGMCICIWICVCVCVCNWKKNYTT